MQKGTVINFEKVRNEKMQERKRRYERTMFRHILGTYCVSEGEGLKAIELVDISLEGLSFQLPIDSKNLSGFDIDTERAFRVYFTEDTFLPIQVQIRNMRQCIENGATYVRFGCAIDKSLQSYEAFRCFVSFLEKYTENCQKDNGDLKFLFF